MRFMNSIDLKFERFGCVPSRGRVRHNAFDEVRCAFRRACVVVGEISGCLEETLAIFQNVTTASTGIRNYFL